MPQEDREEVAQKTNDWQSVSPAKAGRQLAPTDGEDKEVNIGSPSGFSILAEEDDEEETRDDKKIQDSSEMERDKDAEEAEEGEILSLKNQSNRVVSDSNDHGVRQSLPHSSKTEHKVLKKTAQHNSVNLNTAREKSQKKH